MLGRHLYIPMAVSKCGKNKICISYLGSSTDKNI